MSEQARKPYFFLYADDFVSGVLGMPDDHVGIYIKLLCLAWSKDGVSEMEARSVSRDDEAIQSVLRSKFERSSDGRWRNSKLEKVREFSERQSQNGAKKKAKRKPEVEPNPKPHTHTHIQNQSIHPEPEPKPSSTIKKKTVSRSPPTIEQVRSYILSRKSQVDPDQFFDHYTANGWKQSNGNPIKDWQAAVRTWERNEFGKKAKEEAAVQESNKHNRKRTDQENANSARFQLVKVHGVKEARNWSDEECLKEYKSRIFKTA